MMYIYALYYNNYTFYRIPQIITSHFVVCRTMGYVSETIRSSISFYEYTTLPFCLTKPFTQVEYFVLIKPSINICLFLLRIGVDRARTANTSLLCDFSKIHLDIVAVQPYWSIELAHFFAQTMCSIQLSCNLIKDHPYYVHPALIVAHVNRCISYLTVNYKLLNFQTLAIYEFEPNVFTYAIPRVEFNEKHEMFIKFFYSSADDYGHKKN